MPVRLVIETDGNEFRLVRRDRVEMTLPAQVQPESGGVGVVAELRGKAGKSLFRQSVSSQVDVGTEVFSPDGMRRVEIPERKRVLILLVPDDEPAEALVFLAPQPGSAKERRGAEAVREIGRISLVDEDE
jgi:hypothetical protein